MSKSVKQMLKKREGITTRQVATAQNISMDQARRILSGLHADGYAVPVGEKRARVWHKA